MTLTARPRLLIRFAVLAALALCGIVLALSSTGTPPVGAQDGSAPADGYSTLGSIIPALEGWEWTLDYPGDSIATVYQLDDKAFTVEFPFPEALAGCG